MIPEPSIDLDVDEAVSLGKHGRLLAADLTLHAEIDLCAEQDHRLRPQVAARVRMPITMRILARDARTATSGRERIQLAGLLNLVVEAAGDEEGGARRDAVYNDDDLGGAVPVVPERALLVAALILVVEARDDEVAGDAVDGDESRLGRGVPVPVDTELVVLRGEEASDELRRAVCQLQDRQQSRQRREQQATPQ